MAGLEIASTMALEKRHLILAARTAAILAALGTRRGVRHAALRAHDFLWLYPTLRRNCDWHGPVAKRFETKKREVWLTIDDGPDPHDTPEILTVLDRYDVRATFFMIGKKVEHERELVREVAARGHTLGNHTYSHPSAMWWAYWKMLVRREVELGNHAIRTATGQMPRWFRSPVGMNNFDAASEARRCGQQVVGWSSAAGDGCPTTPTQIVKRIMHSLRPGAIVLLHEGGGSRHRVLTVARLMEAMAEGGWRCVLPDRTILR